jgi:hypothetical protein
MTYFAYQTFWFGSRFSVFHNLTLLFIITTSKENENLDLVIKVLEGIIDIDVTWIMCHFNISLYFFQIE